MEFFKKLLYITGLGFIALFLFVTHAKFLHEVDPGTELFVFFEYDAKQLIPYIFGAAFGIIPTVIIALLSTKDRLFWHFTIAIAVLESLGVFAYNNTTLPDDFWRNYASIYYAIYAGIVVLMYAYISNSKEQVQEQKIAGKSPNADIDLNAIQKQIKDLQDEVHAKAMQKMVQEEGAAILHKGTGEKMLLTDKMNVSKGVFTHKPNNTPIPILERNKEILQMEKDGISRQEIAKHFGISESTVSRAISKYSNHEFLNS